MLSTTDLAALYDATDGMTVAATFGAETTQVHFRQPTIEAFGGERQDRDYTMRYRASTLATLARGSTVTIGAVSYRVNAEPEYLGTGDERIARLSRI